MSEDNISKRTRSLTGDTPTYRSVLLKAIATTTANKSDITNTPESSTGSDSLSSEEKNENDDAVAILTSTSTNHEKNSSQLNILEEKINFLESENTKLKVRVSQFKRNNSNLNEKFLLEAENNKVLAEKLAVQEALTLNLIRVVYNLREKMNNK